MRTTAGKMRRVTAVTTSGVASGKLAFAPATAACVADGAVDFTA